MASKVEWERYCDLKDLIAEAVEAAVEKNSGWDEGGITIAISPDLNVVVAGFAPLCELGNCDGWNIERVWSEEEAYEIAEQYFDLR